MTVKGRSKEQRAMIARVKAAGCQVVPSGKRGGEVTVVTPDGQRVQMSALTGARAEQNFIAHLRRCGVDLDHHAGGVGRAALGGRRPKRDTKRPTSLKDWDKWHGSRESEWQPAR